MGGEPGRYWSGIYRDRGSTGVSWFQPEPRMSLELVDTLPLDPARPAVDIGGGASRLARRLLDRGWRDVTVLDVSATALEAARAQNPDAEARITWLERDVLTWTPDRTYGLWHDRAVFHFLVDDAGRATYLRLLRAALEPGGGLVLATFAEDGPEHCSGLPVRGHTAHDLAAFLGDEFAVRETRREEHHTPSRTLQPFTWIAATRVR